MMEPSATQRPDVSVTIVLYNSEEHIGECVGPLREVLATGFAELVTVDNASEDGGAAIVERAVPGGLVLRNASNLGFAAAVNQAWPHVRGRYWLLLNPDAILSADGLDGLVRWMDAHPRLAAGSPLLADRDDEHAWAAAHPLPSVRLVWLELLRLHRLLPRSVRAKWLQGTYWTGGDLLDVGWVPGTAMIVRREAVEQVGLLDEAFFMYGEDIDWCWRMRSAGWRIGSCSSVVARHAGSVSSIAVHGWEEAFERMLRSHVHVLRMRRGPARARAYALSKAALSGLESVHPRRSPAGRADARGFFRAWLSIARTVSSGARRPGRYL
jgi:GT2 family glycosyltransferase